MVLLVLMSSVTRSGNLLDFGQLFEAFGNNSFAQISWLTWYFSSNFCVLALASFSLVWLGANSQCYKTFFGRNLDFPKINQLYKNLFWCMNLHKMWKNAIFEQKYSVKLFFCFLDGLFLMCHFRGKSRYSQKKFYNIDNWLVVQVLYSCHNEGIAPST